MSIRYSIVSTGSQGNSVVIEDFILIDCGVPYKLLEPYVGKLKLVLLTHIHGDHFRKSTIRRLAKERPTLRFGCGAWLLQDLLDAGVKPENIDPLEPGTMYGYGLCNVIPVWLTHDVPNCGYKIHFEKDGKLFYATDAANLNGITAKGYDLYMIEANHEEKEIAMRIDAKRAAGEYAYEIRARRNHLSKEQCDDFIYKNIGPNGEYVYMHQHMDDQSDTGLFG